MLNIQWFIFFQMRFIFTVYTYFLLYTLMYTISRMRKMGNAVEILQRYVYKSKSTSVGLKLLDFIQIHFHFVGRIKNIPFVIYVIRVSFPFLFCSQWRPAGAVRLPLSLKKTLLRNMPRFNRSMMSLLSEQTRVLDLHHRKQIYTSAHA